MIFSFEFCFIIRKFDTGGRVCGKRGRIKESESFDKEAEVKESRNVRSADSGGVHTLSFCGFKKRCRWKFIIGVPDQESGVFVFSHISVETLGNSDRRSKNLTTDSHKHREMKLKQTEVPNTPAETQNGSMKKMRHAETTKRRTDREPQRLTAKHKVTTAKLQNLRTRSKM